MNEPTRGLVPRLRFPEFREVGEWEQKQLVKIGETINGLSGKSADDFGEGQPFVTYKQVFDSAWIDFAKCGKVDIAPDEKQNVLLVGDVLFTTSSETPEEVGFASVVLNPPQELTYLNSFCFAFRPNGLLTLLAAFSCYLFRSPIYRKSVVKLAQGSTRFNISKHAFLKLKLPIPSEKEQQKIAACLSSLDALIAAQADKL
ncbi:MAG: restriction endonuclease subunit S, partial [Lamprobacter sp.]|uniref:restriction endonuclease subunit S n=1 Tax=Lamprobacter sp. TaxID=3100796 RepID=UPI002B263016